MAFYHVWPALLLLFTGDAVREESEPYLATMNTVTALPPDATPELDAGVNPIIEDDNINEYSQPSSVRTADDILWCHDADWQHDIGYEGVDIMGNLSNSGANGKLTMLHFRSLEAGGHAHVGGIDAHLIHHQTARAAHHPHLFRGLAIMKDVIDPYCYEGEFTKLAAKDNGFSVGFLGEHRITDDHTQMLFNKISGGDLTNYDTYSSEAAPLAEVMAQLIFTLHDLKGRNLVHRDLKPDNIMVGPNKPKTCGKLMFTGPVTAWREHDCRLTVIDYGLACTMEESKEDERTLLGKFCQYDTDTVGTMEYMAPEVLEKKVDKYTPQVDVYGIGVTLSILYCCGWFVENDTEAAALIHEIRHGDGETYQLMQKYAAATKRVLMQTDVILSALTKAKALQPFPRTAALIAQMLRYDPNDRPSIEELWEEPFIQNVMPYVRLLSHRVDLGRKLKGSIPDIDMWRQENTKHSG